MKNSEVQFMLWMPRSLRDAMHRRARSLGMTASTYVRWLVAQDTGWSGSRGDNDVSTGRDE